MRTPDERDTRYAWYVVALLTALYAVAFIDRQVLNLLVDPIKDELALSEVEVSLLQGLAFMGAYIAFGPVFGWRADVGHRRNLLLFGAILWSAFTVLCGLLKGFAGLFIARAGVGAAEACLIPAAWSLLSDYFSRERLPRAMSVFVTGPYIGGGLALIFGGTVIGSVDAFGAFLPLLADLSPWRLVFVCVGAPGLLLGLALLTIREPRRRSFSAVQASDRRFTLREVAMFLWQGRAFFVRFYVGMSAVIVALYALPAWIPAFLIRNHGANAAQVGLQYGTLVLVAGTLGVLSGPLAARWLHARGHVDAPVRACAWAGLALVPFCAMLPLAPSYVAALALAAGATFCYSFPQSMAAAALQFAAPNRMRGVVSSIYVFLASVIGLGLAPTLVAAITQWAFNDPARVGESLGIVSGTAGIVAALLMFGSLAHYRRAVERA